MKKLIGILLCLLIAVPSAAGSAIGVSAQAAPGGVSKTEVQSAIDGLLSWRKGSGATTLTAEYLETVGAKNANIDWVVFGMARAGVADDYAAYLKKVEEYITGKYANNGKLDSVTDLLRFTLAVKAAGGNVEAFAQDQEGKPINLVKEGVFSGAASEGLGQLTDLYNLSYALLVLNSDDYALPEGDYYKGTVFVQEILTYQLADGGFSTWSDTVDVDTTAIVVQALAPYYNDTASYTYTKKSATGAGEVTATVKQVVDEALAVLSGKSQFANGGFGGEWGASPESAAQVITALSALGIDMEKDARFIKESTALKNFLSYRNEDGSFRSSFDEGANDFTSTQALYALVAYSRLLNGERSLYNMRPEIPAPANLTWAWILVSVGAVLVVAAGIAAFALLKKRAGKKAQ